MTVHLVEPGGRGGVYQHTVAVAGELAAAGVPVEVHTAAGAEELPVTATFGRRTCLWSFGWLRPRWLRRTVTALGWLAVGTPACIWPVGRGDVVHLQGRFSPALLLPLMSGLRVRRCTVAWSPHTTFSRSGRACEERLVHWMARRSDVVLAYSEWDCRRIEDWGARVVRVPMPFLTPRPDPEAVAAWRRRWLGGTSGRAVLFAGQVRPDKGLDILLRSAAGWMDEAALAVVGEDVGAAGAAKRLAAELGVEVSWDCSYQPFPRFVAAVAAADVIVCPQRVASQSGVLAMARALGRPTVSSAVGGLPELATVVVPPQDVDALSGAIRRVLNDPPEVGDYRGHEPVADVAHAYLEAYGVQS